MSQHIYNLRRVELQPRIPDGTYIGVRSGFTVGFAVDDVQFEGMCETGVRGINIPCVVVVEDGEARCEN